MTLTATPVPATPKSPAQAENYQSFMDRCEVLFPHAECVRISLVYKMVKHSHRFDVRKDEKGPEGEPVRYFEHLRRVGLIFIQEVGLADFAVVLEALLHDTLEDTNLTAEEVSALTSPAVARGVLLMSKKPKQGFMERLVAHGTWREFAVKIADRIDNLRSLGNSTPEFRAKQVAETRELYLPMCELLRSASVGTGHEQALSRLISLLQRTLVEVSSS